MRNISFIFIYYQKIEVSVSYFNCVCLLLSLSTVDGLDIVWCHFVWTHLRMSSIAALTARNKLASTDECKLKAGNRSLMHFSNFIKPNWRSSVSKVLRKIFFESLFTVCLLACFRWLRVWKANTGQDFFRALQCY